MSAPNDPDYCVSCQGMLDDEPSVFADLCRTCVARVSQDALDELYATTGAVCDDAYRLDREMLHLAGLPITTTDGETELDIDDLPWGETWHRLRLLWVLAAAVDQLRLQLADEPTALLAGESREVPTRTAEEDEPGINHDMRCQDLEVADARTQHLAALARRSLIARHALKTHAGPIDSCTKCRDDWAVVTTSPPR